MQDLAHILAEVVPQGHYVGGIVRSSLLKKQSGDIDITLPANKVKPAALALAKRLKAATFEMDPELGVWRLVTHRQKIQIDLTAYQGKDLTADLKRRDFTFNSLAYPVSAKPQIVITPRKNDAAYVILKRLRKDQIVDKTGGITDLKNKLIRLNGPTRFVEDPLRMLRAFRCAAELKFTITPATLAQIKKNKNLIKQPAGERIKEELDRLFAVPGKTYEYLVQMDRCGLLTALFPPLEDQRACAEVYYGPGGVLRHTFLVCKRMDYVLEHLDKAFPKYAKKLTPFCQNKSVYKMVALLHDIAKPKTAKMKDGRLRFFYHEQVGAKMARHVLEHLHYSRADIRLMCAMIGEHLRPSNLASNDILTQRGVYHFFRDLGEAAIPMLLLCWADYTSYVTDTQLRRILPKSGERMMTLTQAERFKNVGKTLRHLQLLHFMLGQFFDRPTTVKPIRVISGQDVMQVLGLEPGPQVGAILEAVAVAQVEGKIKTRKEALAFLKNLPSGMLVPK
ncbi:MAG: CCA tRNA nucleotidyltransferase [Elusimicrobiaceae bacterium]|nr:CCA tRNA nucleotidyltransferase [Elusimicrobiaceae bacterium]